MSPFDLRAYESEVLKPLRKVYPHLPDDLRARYGVTADLPEDQLAERVKAVVQHWNKVGMRSGPLALVCQQLKREHDERLRSDPDAFTTWAWWRERERARGRELEPHVGALAGELRQYAGTLGAITRATLREQAVAYPRLGEPELDEARRRAGLELVEPVELPSGPGMSGQYRTLRARLHGAGVTSVPALLYPGLTGFAVLAGLTVQPSPGPGGPLSEAALAARAVELDKQPDSTEVRAAKEAVQVLRTEARAGTDLAALTLFHLVDGVRDRGGPGAGPVPLFRLLSRSGLRVDEAARIALSLIALPARRDPLTDFEDLLAEGRLTEAEQAADALDGDERTRAHGSVRRVRAEVERLRGLARDDLAAGRDEQAGERLRRALGLACDIEGLERELAAIPAAPVRLVTATPDGSGIRVAWQPAPGHDDGTEFRVVRREARAPNDPDDGTGVAVAGGHTTADPEPPVGRPLNYAVFARSAGGRWSRPASVRAEVVPSVSEVVVAGGEREVTGRWRVHPEASAVEVTRTSADGAGPVPITVERNRSFRDTDVAEGVRYQYRIVAHYLTPAGPRRSEPESVVGAVRPEARPTSTLTAVPVAGGPGLTVRLSWRQRAGSEVVVRRAARTCPWEYGQLVPAEEMARYGEELDGTRTERGDRVTLTAAVPAGRSHFVPFTLTPEGGVRGQEAVVHLSEPLRMVRAMRFGDDIRVTWEWPREVGAADLTWDGGGRRITRQQYREEGGCRLRDLPAVTRVEAGPVVPGGDRDGDGAGEMVPLTTAVEVQRRPPKLRYELRRRGHRLVGGVRCTVTVSTTDTPGEVTLLLVAVPGDVMPQRAGSDGVELVRTVIRVRPGEPVTLPGIAVPSHVRKPYWLRCFLAQPAGALLVDPPVSQLKVC